MQKISRLAAFLIASAILSAPAFAADKGKALVTVNGQAIPQAVFDTIIAEQKAQGAPDTPQVKEAIKNQLIARELLQQEAKKKGFDKKPDVQLQFEAAKQAILVNAFLADYVRSHPLSDAQLKSDYETYKAGLGNTEFKIRHILVNKEDDAKAIIAKLDKGERFSELAKQSEDTGSKDKGGELGWSFPNAFPGPFGEAVSKLKKSEYTKAPVKTNAGFHIIQVDEIRVLTPPTFEQIKPQLQQRAGNQQVEALVKELRDKAKIN